MNPSFPVNRSSLWGLLPQELLSQPYSIGLANIKNDLQTLKKDVAILEAEQLQGKPSTHDVFKATAGDRDLSVRDKIERVYKLFETAMHALACCGQLSCSTRKITQVVLWRYNTLQGMRSKDWAETDNSVHAFLSSAFRIGTCIQRFLKVQYTCLHLVAPETSNPTYHQQADCLLSLKEEMTKVEEKLQKVAEFCSVLALLSCSQISKRPPSEKVGDFDAGPYKQVHIEALPASVRERVEYELQKPNSVLTTNPEYALLSSLLEEKVVEDLRHFLISAIVDRNGPSALIRPSSRKEEKQLRTLGPDFKQIEEEYIAWLEKSIDHIWKESVKDTALCPAINLELRLMKMEPSIAVRWGRKVRAQLENKGPCIQAPEQLEQEWRNALIKLPSQLPSQSQDSPTGDKPPLDSTLAWEINMIASTLACLVAWDDLQQKRITFMLDDEMQSDAPQSAESILFTQFLTEETGRRREVNKKWLALYESFFSRPKEQWGEWEAKGLMSCVGSVLHLHLIDLQRDEQG